MAPIILVTGGSRSGKSAYAQKVAERLDGPRAFVATCPVLDEEMRQRIRKHQQARRGRGWHTIEEAVNLADTLRDARDYQVLLVDCLTLWVNNLLHEAEQTGGRLEEAEIEERCRGLLGVCDGIAGTVIFVTNEVGWGIVPGNALTRRYRDILGRCNQVMAAGADEVILVACGIPIPLKRGREDGDLAGKHD